MDPAPPKRQSSGNASGNNALISSPPRTFHKLEFGIGAIRSTSQGFSRLGALTRNLLHLANCDVTIDMSKLDWFDGHMAAPLRIIVRQAEMCGNKINFTRPRPDVETVLRKNGFLPGRIPDHHKTTMPVAQFGLDDGVEFSLYAKRHFDRKEMPKMSKALQSKFFEGIDELFANSALHSKSEPGVSVGGQFYPKQSRLDFTLVDGGRGIPGSVRSVIKDRPMSDADAISWAMTENNTTRQGDIPGGLGSKILRDFISLNKGKLIIASNGGFWCQEGRDVRWSRLSYAFPGTAVLLEINTADRGRYDLVSTPHPRDIW